MEINFIFYKHLCIALSYILIQNRPPLEGVYLLAATLLKWKWTLQLKMAVRP